MEDLMRIALCLIVAAILCLGGYGLAFQQPAGDAPPRVPVHRVVDQGRTPTVHADRPANPYPPNPYPNPYPPVVATTTLSGGAMNQQLAVLISKAGLRFLSPRVGLDVFDDAELQTDGLLVLCDSAEVNTDHEGKPEVVCHGAAVIKAAGMGGKAGQLRYKAGCLVLEGDDSDAVITRSKGDKTVFMLRAKTINVNLNTQQIEASDGSTIQLKGESKPAPAAVLPSAADEPPSTID
jgi:hypothetical protein